MPKIWTAATVGIYIARTANVKKSYSEISMLEYLLNYKGPAKIISAHEIICSPNDELAAIAIISWCIWLMCKLWGKGITICYYHLKKFLKNKIF